MKFDWKRMEDEMLAGIKARIDDFAKDHQQETFYGFALDSNAFYFEVLGSLNTEDKLHANAVEFQKQFQREHPSWTLHEFQEYLRWDSGSWGYFEVYSGGCDPDDDPEPYREEYLDMCCRVAARLSLENVFSTLKTTPEFRVICRDHDEKLEEGEKRLQRIRKALSNRRA